MISCDFSTDPVCFPQEYVEVTQDIFGIRRGDPPEPSEEAFARTEAKVINLFSDAVRMDSPSGLSQTCDGDICVHYAKSCNIASFSCRYVIGVQKYPPDANFKFPAREFMILATSAEGLSRAEGAIEIGRPGASNTIKLTALSNEVSKAELEKFSSWRLG